MSGIKRTSKGPKFGQKYTDVLLNAFEVGLIDIKMSGNLR